MNQKDLRNFCRNAKRAGALKAKVIATESVITANWVRYKCQYGCDGYGACLTCPPYSPTPEETERILEEYETGILLHGSDHVKLTRITAQLEREVFLAGYYKAIAFGSGPCRFCEECKLDEGCKHPMLARPSMESAGINVFETVQNNGFGIQVVTCRESGADYFTLVLVE
jgi:predicted metal-binding protein